MKMNFFKNIYNNIFYRQKLPTHPHEVEKGIKYLYDFLITVKEEDYPKYLEQIYYTNTNLKLNLKHPRTLGDKVQWLKLYDSTPLKTKLTDKVLVRDWIKDKIGESYLKPMLWCGEKFDDIPYDILPNKFIIKCNHGCKWFYIIKDKNQLVNNPQLLEYLKKRFEFWLSQNFAFYSGFELQYRDIKPQILIEELLRSDDDSVSSYEIEAFCFNGKPKIIQKVKFSQPVVFSVYNDKFESIDVKFNSMWFLQNEPANDLLKEAAEKSKILSEEFKFVRVDWFVYRNKLYFNEMTFSPHSGFFNFENDKLNMELGKILKIK